MTKREEVSRHILLVKVISSHLTWRGNPHQAWNCVGNQHYLDEALECGHTIEVYPPRKANRRRCFDCYRKDIDDWKRTRELCS